MRAAEQWSEDIWNSGELGSKHSPFITPACFWGLLALGFCGSVKGAWNWHQRSSSRSMRPPQDATEGCHLGAIHWWALFWPPPPVRLSWACHLSWSHLETTLQSSGTFFLLWPPGGSTTQPSCASLLAGDGFGRGELIIVSIYTGSRGKAVAQLWSGRVIQQDRPIHVTALCWVWNP